MPPKFMLVAVACRLFICALIRSSQLPSLDDSSREELLFVPLIFSEAVPDCYRYAKSYPLLSARRLAFLFADDALDVATSASGLYTSWTALYYLGSSPILLSRSPAAINIYSLCASKASLHMNLSLIFLSIFYIQY